ncbi:hypothetical protein ACQCTK_02385 [Streptococcus milleri]
MIANVRVHADGQSSSLCQLDIMKYPKEVIEARMVERGFGGESFFICGFEDWQVDTIMSLDEAYLLRRVIEGLYAGDDFIVVHCLKNHWSVSDIISHHYCFVTKDEVQLMTKILNQCEMSSVVEFFYKANNWVAAVQAYIEKGVVLNTTRGFYIDVDNAL